MVVLCVSALLLTQTCIYVASQCPPLDCLYDSRPEALIYILKSKKKCSVLLQKTIIHPLDLYGLPSQSLCVVLKVSNEQQPGIK